jgi:CBS-domain-containing membrane protein
MNKDKVLQIALGQLDRLGYELYRRGITDQVNRHNLAALALTQQQRLKGEMTRLELRVGLQKARLNRLRHQAVTTIDAVLEYTPAPLSKPLNRAKASLLG